MDLQLVGRPSTTSSSRFGDLLSVNTARKLLTLERREKQDARSRRPVTALSTVTRKRPDVPNKKEVPCSEVVALPVQDVKKNDASVDKGQSESNSVEVQTATGLGLRQLPIRTPTAPTTSGRFESGGTTNVHGQSKTQRRQLSTSSRILPPCRAESLILSKNGPTNALVTIMKSNDRQSALDRFIVDSREKYSKAVAIRDSRPMPVKPRVLHLPMRNSITVYQCQPMKRRTSRASTARPFKSVMSNSSSMSSMRSSRGDGSYSGNVMKMSAIPERRRQEADDQDQEQWEDASHGEEKQTERTNDRLRRFLKSASATYAPIAIINSRTSISWNMVTPRVSTWHTTSSFQTPSASHMQLANGHNNRSRLLAKANPHAPSNSLNLKSHTRPSSSARTALSSADTRQTYRSRLFVADPRQQSARAIRREREAADRQAFFELRLRELQETITNVQALRRAESAKPKMRKGSSIMKGIDRVLESSGKRTRS